MRIKLTTISLLKDGETIGSSQSCSGYKYTDHKKFILLNSVLKKDVPETIDILINTKDCEIDCDPENEKYGNNILQIYSEENETIDSCKTQNWSCSFCSGSTMFLDTLEVCKNDQCL